MASELNFEGEGRASYEIIVRAMLDHWDDISAVTTKWYSGGGGERSAPLRRSMLTDVLEHGIEPNEWHFRIKFKSDEFAIWFQLRYM